MSFRSRMKELFFNKQVSVAIVRKAELLCNVNFLCLFTAVIVNQLHNYIVAGLSTGSFKESFFGIKETSVEDAFSNNKDRKNCKSEQPLLFVFEVSLR